jgi:hypothetical protein
MRPPTAFADSRAKASASRLRRPRASTRAQTGGSSSTKWGATVLSWMSTEPLCARPSQAAKDGHSPKGRRSFRSLLLSPMIRARGWPPGRRCSVSCSALGPWCVVLVPRPTDRGGRSQTQTRRRDRSAGRLSALLVPFGYAPPAKPEPRRAVEDVLRGRASLGGDGTGSLAAPPCGLLLMPGYSISAVVRDGRR